MENRNNKDERFIMMAAFHAAMQDEIYYNTLKEDGSTFEPQTNIYGLFSLVELEWPKAIRENVCRIVEDIVAREIPCDPLVAAKDLLMALKYKSRYYTSRYNEERHKAFKHLGDFYQSALDFALPKLEKSLSHEECDEIFDLIYDYD